MDFKQNAKDSEREITTEIMCKPYLVSEGFHLGAQAKLAQHLDQQIAKAMNRSQTMSRV